MPCAPKTTSTSWQSFLNNFLQVKLWLCNEKSINRCNDAISLQDASHPGSVEHIVLILTNINSTNHSWQNLYMLY